MAIISRITPLYFYRRPLSRYEKIQAIIEDIKERTAKGQPVLVGTISIEKSEPGIALFPANADMRIT